MHAPFSLEQLPTKPGCYLYKDSTGELIYIGKAKNIKKRVSSYFTKDHEDTKTSQLVENIVSVETIVTKNEVEALLLESSLIRQHKPKYNIDLKYGVRYAWIVLTNEQFPRLITARTRNLDGEYFGPFVSGTLRRALIEILRKRFFIRTCRKLPKKVCLKYHIGQCKGPCEKKQTPEDYKENVEKVRAYLRGKNNDLITQLKTEMQTFSSRQEFELAKLRKEQIESLEYLHERIIVENSRLEEQDVIAFRRYVDTKDYIEKAAFLVFSFRRGVLSQRQEFIVADEEHVLDEFIKRFYEITPPPTEILIEEDLADTRIEAYLEEIAGHKVNLHVPQRGLKKELLELVQNNIVEKVGEAELLAMEIKEQLEIDWPVRTIECFDISHHQGSDMVGAMVHFKDGKPLKSKYRKFHIKTVKGIDDFRAIEEVVMRRYARLRKERAEFPDLILIDGGEVQLKFAVGALEKLGIVNQPIAALAKREEEVYVPKKKKAHTFDKKSLMMRTFMQARDEAHRFGITFHRSLRKKKLK